jgi:hypothetical protein
MERRQFIKQSTLASLAIPALAQSALVSGPERMVGIQITAASFVDEGVNQVLDTVQEKASVNALFLPVLAFNEGLAGRQLKGFPFPDHGKKIYHGDDGFQGGYFARFNAKYHRSEWYKSFSSPDFPNFDLLGDVIPAAKKRGIKTFAFFADNIRSNDPIFKPLLERKLDGSTEGNVCMNNPIYRELLFGILEDCMRSYPLDGILYRSERIGPLSKALGLTHLGFSEPVCFCQHCETKAKNEGLNLIRIREGYTQLKAFITASRAEKRPIDGYHVTFLRLLLKYPEILQWQTFQTDSLQKLYRDVYNLVKSIDPKLMVGYAVPVNNGLNPIYRAEQNWQEMSTYSDFLKVTMYESVIGARMSRYISNAASVWYGDLNEEQMLELEYTIMGYQQPKFAELETKGFSNDYIVNETARIRQHLKGTLTKIWSGIDVDLPSVNNIRNLGAEGLKNSIKAAFKGGADGIILSRKYSEMNLSTLVGAGQAIKEG